jgi:hypothetical protein
VGQTRLSGLGCIAAAAAMVGASVLAVAGPASAAAPAAASAGKAAASGIRRTKDGKPDLSGFWDLSRKPVTPDPALLAKLAPNTVVVNDVGAPELPQGNFGGLKPTAAALAVAKTWKQEDDMVVSKACAPPSIIYSMQGPFPIEIEQYPDIIVIKLEFFDLVRLIRVGGKHRPENAPHSKVGDSIAHWEGDTLVVDTTHLEAATITNNGLYHSDKAHVIERFKLSADGKTLISSQEFEDPESIENRGARFINWELKPGEYVYPYECDPTFGLNYGNAKKE